MGVLEVFLSTWSKARDMFGVSDLAEQTVEVVKRPARTTPRRPHPDRLHGPATSVLHADYPDLGSMHSQFHQGDAT